MTTTQTVPRDMEKHHSSIILVDPLLEAGLTQFRLASQVQGEKTSTAKFLTTITAMFNGQLIPFAALATPPGGRFSRLEGELGCLGEEGREVGIGERSLFASTYRLSQSHKYHKDV